VAAQIYSWIFSKGCLDPQNFSNIPKELRSLLTKEFSWQLPTIDSHLISKDGSEKFLLKTTDGFLFEMVFMFYDDRSTLCISSQVGCKMGCTFCQTGKMGFRRNLSSGEILSQILLANQKQRVTNVVFMGMGEPLDNYDEVVKACRIMIDKGALALSSSKVTISTSGLVPAISRLGTDLPVRLAISLHSADDEKRSRMMPINRKYPLELLMKACREFPLDDRERLTFEYVMLAGINDSTTDAKRLVRLLNGIRAKINLIPHNPAPELPYRASSSEQILAFQKILIDRDLPTFIRRPRGQEISAACGQLAARPDAMAAQTSR
jgi:23S rRNA (adenine2503-C2)-methyltransferase